MTAKPKKYNFGSVTDVNENNRLMLIFESRVYEGKETGFDFHSLVWETKDNGKWVTKKVISEEEFDSDPVYRKWPNELHSFDPQSGQAIIKVGEGDAPRSEDQMIIYSWRRWDLNNNFQTALLKVCEDPFEEYQNESS